MLVLVGMDILNILVLFRCRYILGEHGDSSVPVWSQTFFGGLRLADRLPELLDAGKDTESQDPLVRSLLSIPAEVRSVT